MATYTNYPNGIYLDKFDLNGHGYYYYGSQTSISISDFDYANNYLVLIKDSAGSSYSTTYFAFSDTTATMISSNNNTSYANIYVYEVSSSSFTIRCISGGVYYYWNYFYIPKTTTVIYGTGPSSTGIQNISVPSNIDFTGDVFAILPIYDGGVKSGATQLKYILYGSNVFYNLVKVNDNASIINGNVGATSCPIAYFQFTSKIDIPSLQVGDILNYTAGTNSIDFTGYQFGCRLKGYTTSYSSSLYAYGANCYAEFDFSSVSDGKVTVGSNYGAYIALTNGTGTDIKYNRMMVAGDAGGASYYSGPYGGSGISAGGNAGLFGGSGSNGSSDYSANSAKGGTQTSGGAKHSSRTEAAANGSFGTGGTSKYSSTGGGYYYYSGSGGAGWYGGGGGNSSTSNNYCTSGGGSSSYLLTSSSAKPTGYFPEWTTYQPLISNGTSELQSTTRDYYATITILAAPVSGPYPTSLTLSGQTTSYHVNDTFSFDGTCTANYSDGTSATVTPTSVSTPDMTTAGIKTVTVTYTEGSTTVTATYDITVSTVSLTSITLSGQTTSYYVGDTFTFTGTCTAHYDDTSSLVVNPTSVSSPDMTTAGSKTITVSYTEGGITETATYTITVTAVEAVSISISGQTVTYYQYDTFSIDGTVTATYNNGSTEDVTSQSTASGYDTSYIGSQTVTITWSGLTTTITINVIARTPTSLTAYGVKTSFSRGEPFGFGTGFFIATFNNGTQSDVTADVVASGYDTYTEGTYTVIVKYTSNNTTVSTSYQITVTAPQGTTYMNYNSDYVLTNNITTKTVSSSITNSTYTQVLTLSSYPAKILAVGCFYTCQRPNGNRQNPGLNNPVYSSNITDSANIVDLTSRSWYNSRKLFTANSANVSITFPAESGAKIGYLILPASATVVDQGYVEAFRNQTISLTGYDFTNYQYYLFADTYNKGDNTQVVSDNLQYVGGIGDRTLHNSSYATGSYASANGMAWGGGQGIYRIRPSSSSTWFKAQDTFIRDSTQWWIGGDNWYVIRVAKSDMTPPTLKVGDIIYYTLPETLVNLKYYNFHVELYGSNSGSYKGYKLQADVDFSNPSVKDGLLRIGSKYGGYIAVENGDGTDTRYNRILVAGDASSSHNGGAIQTGAPDTTVWDQASTFGQYGWYTGDYNSNWGTSYALTPTSYKPAGYFTTWSNYSPVISNVSGAATGQSSILGGGKIIAKITILSIPLDKLRTVRYFNGSVYNKCKTMYYTGSEWVLCNMHYYADRLPSAYQEVEYISTDGVAYIDTGILPGPRTRVTCKALLPEDSGYLFGFVSVNSYAFLADSSIHKYKSMFGTENSIFLTPNQTLPFTIDKNMNTTVITASDGTEYEETLTDQDFSTSMNIYLFGASSAGSIYRSASGTRIYECKIYSGGTLVRHFVPCYKKSNNAVGFYDLKNNVFYEKPYGNSGTLTAGPDKIPHD